MNKTNEGTMRNKRERVTQRGEGQRKNIYSCSACWRQDYLVLRSCSSAVGTEEGSHPHHHNTALHLLLQLPAWPRTAPTAMASRCLQSVCVRQSVCVIFWIVKFCAEYHWRPSGPHGRQNPWRALSLFNTSQQMICSWYNDHASAFKYHLFKF